MALFNRDALKPGVRPREVWAWAAYDFANSGYTTVVLTAVFNAYFVSTVATDAGSATFLWTCIVALSNAVSMLAMPVIGALADARAMKKRWLFFATLFCVLGTVGLVFTGPGTVVLAAVMIVVSNVAYNIGESLSSAFLPELAREEAIGKVSGWGWSLGYCGGIVTLALCLAVVINAPALGLSVDGAISATMLITALVYAVAAMPLFVFLTERSRPRLGPLEKTSFKRAFFDSFNELKTTASSLNNYKDFTLLALCGFLYQCGVAVVITLSAVYASAVLGFTTEKTLLMVFLVNITAAVGAFCFGYLQDKIGHKWALAMTLAAWLGMVVMVSTATHSWQFWIAANLAGLAMGSCQSAGRALVGLFAPPSRLAEFYSFWNITLWFSAIVGPLSYGAVTWLFDNDHRLAILVTGLFFAAALVALLPLNVERGKRAAQRPVH